MRLRERSKEVLAALVVVVAAAGAVWYRNLPAVPELRAGLAPNAIKRAVVPGVLAPNPEAGDPEAATATPAAPLDLDAETIAEQRRVLLENMRRALVLEREQLDAVEAVFERSPVLSQGNPDVTEHPMTRAECRTIRARAGLDQASPRPKAACDERNMVPLFNPEQGQTARDAKVCIDQFEFPNIPCEYPVVWVRADEAASLCEALGKRLCDAHEWEGGCAGALLPPEEEYAWGERRLMMEHLHNKKREIVWAYGSVRDPTRCAMASRKSPRCWAGGFRVCGSNTYPAGAFPECVSAFGVYDQHGNAAEHMSLPLTPAELGSRGGSGETEMKGSWFIFAREPAHPDDCRWRALNWHGSKIRDPGSHRNYHLGFRCCKDVGL